MRYRTTVRRPKFEEDTMQTIMDVCVLAGMTLLIIGFLERLF